MLDKCSLSPSQVIPDEAFAQSKVAGIFLVVQRVPARKTESQSPQSRNNSDYFGLFPKRSKR